MPIEPLDYCRLVCYTRYITISYIVIRRRPGEKGRQQMFKDREPRVTNRMFGGREPGGLDPLGSDDNLTRLRYYDRAMRRRALGSPTIAFLVGLVFIVFGVWTLLSGVAYLGYALFFLGLGAFFALVTGLMIWRDARRRRTNLGQ